MRTCRICKEKKSFDNYHRREGGYRTACKKCRAKIHKKKKRVNDGYYTVYYLPEHHYVGMTNSVKYRMQEHRNKNKRFTEGYEIIGTYERAVDAHLVETILHTMGYNGFYYKGIENE